MSRLPTGSNIAPSFSSFGKGNSRIEAERNALELAVLTSEANPRPAAAVADTEREAWIARIKYVSLTRTRRFQPLNRCVC
jgi:hypothetical protein